MKTALKAIYPSLRLEIFLIFCLSIAVYAFSIYYDFFEKIVSFSQQHEDWEIDELFTLMFFSSFALSAILFRMMNHLNKEFEERKKAEEKIKKMAFFDDLTGWPNRALCNDRLEHVVLHAKRYQLQAAVLFIDLDNFKFINDSFGHSAGDELLKQAALRLSKHLREDDTLARIAGDEFVIIVEAIHNATDVTNLAAKLLNMMEKPFFLAGSEAYVSCSIGIAVFPADGQSAEHLIQNADIAMYHAKKKGKNTFEFFSASIDEQAKKKLQISTHLRQALANREFFLNYQPILDVHSGEIKGCEALLRWHNPTIGPVGPGQFIPIAEETGMILTLGDWVLLQACRQNMRWQTAGFPPIVMSVNLSARQLLQEKYVDSVECILAETGMDPQYLEMELTESTIMKDIKTALTILNKLKTLGISLSLDDFGTGYSSISYLRRLNLHRLKIDRSFIKEIPHSKEDIVTTNAILSLAKNLCLNVTAEGIETKEQWEYLQQTQCDSMQGFYFSRPVSAKAFEEILVDSLGVKSWWRKSAD